MMNLVCEVRFAQERHNEHLREAEQRRLLCSSTSRQSSLLDRWQAKLMNRVSTAFHSQHNEE